MEVCASERDQFLSSGGRALQELQDSESRLQKHVAHLSAMVAAKNTQLKECIDVVEPLHEKLTELQDAYVHQTRTFGSFVAAVRKQQRDVELFLGHARCEIHGHRRTAAACNSDLADAAQAHRQTMAEIALTWQMQRR